MPWQDIYKSMMSLKGFHVLVGSVGSSKFGSMGSSIAQMQMMQHQCKSGHSGIVICLWAVPSSPLPAGMLYSGHALPDPQNRLDLLK